MIDPDDVAVFQLSGGTTGVPKVIPRQHAEYWYNARAWARHLGWDNTVRTLHSIPLVHNAGIVCALHAVHSVGGAFVIGTSQPDEVLQAMIDHAITDTLTPPGLAVTWCEHPLFDTALATMQRIAMAGSEITDELFDAFESRGVRVVNMFGMGEGLCMATPLDAPRELRQHSIGYPLSDLDEVKVLALGTESAVAQGEIGELCARGPYTLRGYLASPERNAVALTTDGYYRTGDLVAWHQSAAGSYYTFEGRAKDLVNRGGEKINSAEIEGLVSEIPGVRRAALIPIPDPRLGERACLCVEISTGTTQFTLDRVREHLHGREVAKFKWPEFLEYFDELPTTPSAKIDKRRLTEIVCSRTTAATS
jgi:2,3-dihydroxybenzoate-AMP ligase